MTPAPAHRVRALSIHAGYRCRHAGACCTSGWDIPVEPETEERLRAALRSGVLRLRDRDGLMPPMAPSTEREPEGCFRSVEFLPHGARVVLRTDDAGRCVFLDPRLRSGGRCAVHGGLGEEALPSACRHFPRVVTLTPLGVSVTLSHYCPTAAGMLFVIPSPDPRGTRVAPSDDLSCRALPGDASGSVSAPREGPDEGLRSIGKSSVPPGDEKPAGPPESLRIVEDPPAFPAQWPWEGLDAREALPPLLRPGVLMDWPSLERWERFAVSVLAEDDHSPEAALDVLAAAAEDARRWTPAAGPFAPFLEGVLALSPREPAPAPSFRGASVAPGDEESAGAGGAWPLVAACVPRGAPLPPAPEGLGEADERWVAPGWPALALPIRRWLAAKAFASWVALQGGGLRTTVAFLRVALGVLRAEAARGSAEAVHVLDADLFLEAIRRADLLLVHLADPETLARRLGRCEAHTP